MRRIAHIINPFIASVNSDLYTAQPITFQSMKEARDYSVKEVDVELWATCFEEDQNIIPSYFNKTPLLRSSVLDYGDFNTSIKLPLIREILDKLYQSSNADYLIYTNVDIGVYPNFYKEVNRFLDQGYDAFIINRRRLPAKYSTIQDLPLIYKDQGKSHPGFDCFIFSRKLYPKFCLSNICIGVPFIGITLSQNIFTHSSLYNIYEDEILTFHIGEEIFKNRAPKGYFKYNQKEFWKSMKALRSVHSFGKLPYNSTFFLKRIFKYTIHPSIPIRWVMVLIWDRIKFMK